MITIYQNFEIVASVLFYLVTKFLCYFYNKSGIGIPMHGRKTVLSSIPENDYEEQSRDSSSAHVSHKWVPKKKHEVLKAKYKCLKKLFQIYDASVIGILPEPNEEIYPLDEPSPRRKRRSHRTKTDACAGTSETSQSDSIDTQPIAKSVIKDLNIQCSCSTQFYSDQTSVPDQKLNQESQDTLCQSSIQKSECEYVQTNYVPYHLPYPQTHMKKLTRFQSFIHRIFGLAPEKRYRNNMYNDGHVYAASDDNIMNHYYGNRRRKRLRFRGYRRPKKVRSEISLRDMKSPSILNYVQSVQKHYLTDTTPRQCPINGCRMMTYGLINYNDHLNLCHFPERKHLCHYCHEGFEQPIEKSSHENEHIGISKLNFNSPSSTIGPSVKKASKTQTDPVVSEEKLKKIVSFFDKIVENDRLINDIKNNRYSESNLHSSKTIVTTTDNNESMSDTSSEKRTVSCGNLVHRNIHKGKPAMTNSNCSNLPVKCHFCGENFDYRRQLSLHVDLEHRIHDKFSKFHSCAGITNPHLSCCYENHSRKEFPCSEKRCTENRSDMNFSDNGIAKKDSDLTLSCDPSTNIIFYESLEAVEKKSLAGSEPVDSRHSHVHQNQKITRYKWEPGTKIIRV